MKLAITIAKVVPKSKVPFFFATEPSPFVIIDFSELLILISLSDEKKFNKHGRSRKVTTNEIINPKVIIQPKSIIGLMPLKIKDKKAQIVVKTV